MSTRRRPRPPIPRAPGHALQRARERYGLDLAPRDLRDVAESIESGDPTRARLIVRQTDGREAWMARVSGVWTKLIFDTAHREVVTFVPPAAQWSEFGTPVIAREITLEEQIDDEARVVRRAEAHARFLARIAPDEASDADTSPQRRTG